MAKRLGLVSGGFRRIALAALCATPIAAGAQTTSRLPPNPPTSLANPNSLPAPIAAGSVASGPLQRHRARVTYMDGMLEVRADNSSLNQILREVSRETGMKIVGGVADQRVFGSYGPAPAGTVLQTLLDGTNTNMLLRETPSTHAPVQLVLTPRQGGPTPPGPSSASYDATEAEPELAVTGAPSSAPSPIRSGARSSSMTSQPNGTGAAGTTSPTMPQPANNVLGNPNNVSPTASTLPVTDSVPVSSLPIPSTVQPVSGIVDSPNPPPAGTTTSGYTSQTPADNNPNTAPPATSPSTTPPTATQTSPGGEKTPQEIYQELKLLQQKQTQPGTPQGSATPQ
jgi:hypothetical protein